MEGRLVKIAARNLLALTLWVLGLSLTGPISGGGFGPAQQLETWIRAGVVDRESVRRIPLEAQVLENGVFVLDGTRPISGLAIDGTGVLRDARSGIRVVLVDEGLHEYLVAEAYPLLTEGRQFKLDGACRETCVTDPLTPFRLKVIVENASLRISGLQAVFAGSSEPGTKEIIEGMAAAQATEIVTQLNSAIQRWHLRWVAGETGISRLPYDVRRRRSPGGEPPISHGFEYYIGGIYALPSEETTPQNGEPLLLDRGGSIPIVGFDWRRKHDADRPGSPYYDGDAAGGGWMTPVRHQACSDCWAHATVAMVEALVNLSTNRHVDVDLAEQELLSCSGAGTCAGGRVSLALEYLSTEGVGGEACFPYEGADVPCGYSCGAPRTRAFAGQWEEVHFGFSEVAIKEALVSLGPLVLGIRSQWHLVLLVGYDRDQADNRVVWIIKNSWGDDWGEAGYGLVKLPVSDFYAVFGLRSVALVVDGIEIASICRDADRDGYSTWGFRAPRPPGCMTLGGMQDCNDSNPGVGPIGPDGECELINVLPDEPLEPVPVNTGAGDGGGGGSIGGALLVWAGLTGALVWIAHKRYRA